MSKPTEVSNYKVLVVLMTYPDNLHSGLVSELSCMWTISSKYRISNEYRIFLYMSRFKTKQNFRVGQLTKEVQKGFRKSIVPSKG